MNVLVCRAECLFIEVASYLHLFLVIQIVALVSPNLHFYASLSNTSLHIGKEATANYAK